MSELDAKIEMYKDEGWDLKTRTGEHSAIMVKKTWGSKLLHFVLLFLTLGVGNLIYGFWSRIMNSEKMTVHGAA